MFNFSTPTITTTPVSGVSDVGENDTNVNETIVIKNITVNETIVIKNITVVNVTQVNTENALTHIIKLPLS